MGFVIENGVLLRAADGALSGAVVIPEGVRAIGEEAFSEAAGITSVTLPEGLEEIGRCAFFNCSGLESISFPATVSSIGDYAFLGCSGLKSAYLSKGIHSLEWIGSFMCCPRLREIRVDSENPVYCDVGGVLFSKDKTELMLVPQAYPSDEYAVPDCVRKIDGLAFVGNSLKSVVIPEGVASLGSTPLFARSKGIEEVYLKCHCETSLKKIFAYYGGCRIIAPEINGDLFEDAELRRKAALGYAKAWLNGWTTDSEADLSYEKYIRSQKKRLYKFAAEDIWLLRYMTERRIIPAADIDRIMELIPDSSVEQRAVLLEYSDTLTDRKNYDTYRI